MAIAWPAGVPSTPLRQGYGFTPGPGVVRSSMDAGPPFQRRTTSNPGDQHRVTFKFTSAQWLTFHTWWEQTLGRGALKFNWTEPYSNAAVTGTFVGDQPPAVAPAPNGPFVHVTCTIEVI